MEPGIIQQKGYVWLACPREGMMPLNLLEMEDNNLIKRVWMSIFSTSADANVINADIFALFPKPVRGLYPKIKDKPLNVPFFKGHDILDVSAGISIETLKALSFLGSVTAESNLKKATKLLFSFKNAQLITVENEIQLEEHLNIIKPNINAPGFLEKLREGKIYVVTEVLQTTNFSVRSANDFQFSGKINANAIKNFADAKIKLDSQTASDETMTYNNSKPVTFALKASAILYNDKKNNFRLNKNSIRIVKGNGKIEAYQLHQVIPVINI